MKWLTIVLIALLTAGLLIFFVGKMLPEAHTASSSIRLDQSPDRVWVVVRSFDEYPSWWTEVKTVERLPDHNGSEAWRQELSMGPLPMFVATDNPPTRVVTEIIDEGMPFGGTWTYVVEPDGSGTKITVTENGRIYNAFFRVISRFVMGYHGTLDSYLTALGGHFGESVIPEHR